MKIILTQKSFFKYIRVRCGQEGVSLPEIIVSMMIYSILMLAATGVFQMAFESQRQAVAAKNVQESMRYAMEIMAKELRGAHRVNDNACAFSSIDLTNLVYYVKTTGPRDTLYFRNKYDECVKYSLNVTDTAIQIQRYAIGSSPGKTLIITSDDITVAGLKFNLTPYTAHSATGQQAILTIKMTATPNTSKYNKKETIQTTVSARYYE